MIPLKLALFKVATPEAFVIAVPTAVPFKLNATVLPLIAVTGLLTVRVADRFVVPPKVPIALPTCNEVTPTAVYIPVIVLAPLLFG